jgi:hypothetical protein
MILIRVAAIWSAAIWEIIRRDFLYYWRGTPGVFTLYFQKAKIDNIELFILLLINK